MEEERLQKKNILIIMPIKTSLWEVCPWGETRSNNFTSVSSVLKKERKNN